MIQAMLVAVGGAIGSVLRYYVSQWALRLAGPAFPWGTLTVNVVGCFVIGVFAEMIIRRFDASPELRLLLITGFLGGLTTFSSFSAEVVTLLLGGRPLLALGTSMLHLCGSLMLTWLGIRTVQLALG